MFNAAGLTAIGGSTIGDNHAYGNGGGIDAELDGDVSIVGSTVSGNTADDGGGIRNNGNLVVSNSTLSDNDASARGGGIFSNTTLDGRSTTVVNSTISGNTAVTVGGGIYNIDGQTLCQFRGARMFGRIGEVVVAVHNPNGKPRNGAKPELHFMKV